MAPTPPSEIREVEFSQDEFAREDEELWKSLIKELSEQLQRVLSELAEVRGRLDALEEMPGRLWRFSRNCTPTMKTGPSTFLGFLKRGAR